MVTLELESKKKVTTRVRAQWASEQKMSDVLRFTSKLGIGLKFEDFRFVHRPLLTNAFSALRARIKAVKDYCEKSTGLTK